LGLIARGATSLIEAQQKRRQGSSASGNECKEETAANMFSSLNGSKKPVQQVSTQYSGFLEKEN